MSSVNIMVRSRPTRSATHPAQIEPTIWPANPTEMSPPICPGLSFHMPISTGST